MNNGTSAPKTENGIWGHRSNKQASVKLYVKNYNSGNVNDYIRRKNAKQGM